MNITLGGLYLQLPARPKLCGKLVNVSVWESKCSSDVVKWPFVPHYSRICTELSSIWLRCA